jgi:hypothetical protein
MISVKWRDDLTLSTHVCIRQNYVRRSLLLLTQKNHEIVEFRFLMIDLIFNLDFIV